MDSAHNIYHTMNLAPIVLFAYNRPLHVKQTLESLSKNDLAADSELFIFIDGPKENASKETLQNIQNVKAIIREKKWCKSVTIFESEMNKGLANSVINGVTEIVNQFGKIIVLEDDLITSKGFLKYMNNALKKYENDEIVMQVSGYNFPIKNLKEKHTSFFMPLATSWGWGTWERAWEKFDEKAIGYQALKNDSELERKFNLDGSYPYSHLLFTQMQTNYVDSWAIRWWWSIFINKGITLFPDLSLIKNIGYGAESTHNKESNPFEQINFNYNYYISKFPTELIIDDKKFDMIKDTIRKSTSKKHPVEKSELNIFRLIANKLQKIINLK